MATKIPRVYVTFSPATFQAIKELSDATGHSMSGVIASFMDDMAPQLLAIAKAAALAKTNKSEALDLMAEKLGEAAAAVGQGQLDLEEARRRQYKFKGKK